MKRSRTGAQKNALQEKKNKETLDGPETTSEKKKEENDTTTQDSHNEAKRNNESPSCGVCLEIINLQGIIDSCNHTFCFECIHKWSQVSNTCPMCKGRFKAISKQKPGQPPKKKKKADTIKVLRRDANFQDPDEDISQYLNDDDYDETISSEELITRLASGFFSFLDHFLDESDSDSDLNFDNQRFSNVLVDGENYLIEQDDNGRTVIDLTTESPHQTTRQPRQRFSGPRRGVRSPYNFRARSTRGAPARVITNSRPTAQRRNNVRSGSRSSRSHTSTSPNSTTTTTTISTRLGRRNDPSVDITIYSSNSPNSMFEMDLRLFQ